MGTGSVYAPTPPIYLYSGISLSSALAFAAASDTARMALAPRRPLLGVPSSSIIFSSRPTWSQESKPISAFAISVLTFSTALSTPLPPYLFLSPSRSSCASCIPVDAPDGDIATPLPPASVVTTHATVGLPLESSTSLATIDLIALMFSSPFAN